MLSKEDHSCESSQLFKAQELGLSDQTKLDLLPKLSLHQTPLSNFSIREYVFSARSKDIKTNWPFSSKSLQVCMRHGVQDILPPFQFLESGRKQSGDRFDSIATPAGGNEDAGKSREGVEGILCPGACVVANSSENGCLSTSNVFHSEVELVPSNSQSSPQLETDLLESSAEVQTAELRPSRCKAKYSTSAPIKKSKLVVKLGSNTRCSLREDIGGNNTAKLETMASKVCPVCKTFSSSSNTTLNAHIDQCLTGESTPKWNANSSLPRHRIKPRKTRLMTDIYATAKPCTLEDLDRRNGSNWASVQTVPVERTEMSAEGANHAIPRTHNEDNSTAGDVYIDANGIKLRILSKSNVLPLAPESPKDDGPSKQSEGRKFYLTKKKRLHAEREKLRKSVKLTRQSKKFCSHISHNSQVLEDEGKCSLAKGSLQREDGEESSKLQQLNTFGTLPRWEGSKRTALVKKDSKKSGQYASRLIVNVACKLQVKDDTLKLHENKNSAKMAKRIVYPVKEPVSKDRKEQSFGSIIVGIYSNEMADRTIRTNSPSKRASLTSKQCTSTGDIHMFKLPNPTGNHEASLDKQRTGNHAGSCEGPLVSTNARVRLMNSSSASVKNVTKTCTSRNKLSLDSLTSLIPESDMILKSSASKKSRVNVNKEVDDVVAYPSKTWRQDTSHVSHLEKQCTRKKISKSSLGTGSVVAVGRSSRERNSAMKSQLSGCHQAKSREMVSSICINGAFSNKFDGPESVGHEFTIHEDDIVSESLPEASVVQPSTIINKAVKYIDQHNSVKSFRNYDGLLHEDEVPNGTGGTNTQGEGEQDSEFGSESNYPEVDPIPIPGPPGSFLPSPRAMHSEDEGFHWNSLMKKSRDCYYQEKHDMFDRDSSDSLVSATSEVSNPMTGGSERKLADTTNSDGSIEIQDKVNFLGFSRSTIEPPSGHVVPSPCATNINTENQMYGGEIKLTAQTQEERETQRCNDDEEPCHCQWKEITFQNVSMNAYDSNLLSRRAMASSTVPFLLKKQGYGADTTPKNLEALPEALQMRNRSSLVFEKVHPSFPEDSSNAALKFSGRGTSASHSSSPNTVLRLMGKNLVVVNKDEDASMPHGQAERCAQNENCTSQYATSTGLPLSNILPQGWVCAQDSSGTLGLYHGGRMSSEIRNQARQVETQEKPPAHNVHNQLPHGIFAVPLEACPNKNDCISPAQELQYKMRSYTTSHVLKNASEISDSVQGCRHS